MKTKYESYKHRLEMSYWGVTDPAAMGTAGLAGWVITGCGGLRRAAVRVRRAVKILAGRGADLSGFRRHVLSAEKNRWNRERLAQHFDDAGVTP